MTHGRGNSQREGAFSHLIFLHAEGVFFCVGYRADVLCILFYCVALAQSTVDIKV